MLRRQSELKIQFDNFSLIERYFEESDYSNSVRYGRRYLLKRLLFSPGFSFDKTPQEIKDLILDIFGYLKGGSFNLIHTTMNTFFDFCIENQIYLHQNPLNLIKRRKKSKHEPNPFNDSEVKQLLEKCPSYQRFLYEVLLNTGVRIDELVNLRFSDFNSERKLLHVRARIAGGGAKGDKARDIPLPKLLLEKYQVFLADYRQNMFIESDYVFLSRKRKRIAIRSVQGRMMRLSKKLSFRIHAHRFRTTYATHLHREGVSIYIICLLLGHESIETTTDYISVTLEEKRRAVETSTWLGKQQEISKKVERMNREKQDLISQVDDLIKQNQALLDRIRSLNI